MDDATRSRLAVLLRKLGGGALNLYAITHHKQGVVVVVVSTCSEEALKIIRDEVGLEDWNLRNTATRSIQRRVNAVPGVVCAYEVVDYVPKQKK